MNNNLVEYKFTIKTDGPVHIGSGNTFAKYEYVFVNRNVVGITDMAKVYQFMRKHGLNDKFESYILNESKADLLQWIEQYGFNEQDFNSCIRYKLDNGDTALQRGTKVSIMEFVKDAYGNPYVPGSSIKGMLRTILMADDIIKDGHKYASDAQTIRKLTFVPMNYKIKRNSYMGREMKNAEIKRFNVLARDDKYKENAVNDMMSGLIISDSLPLNVKDLVLCQKVERHTDGSDKCLNILRESIRPGTDIEFTITIDTSICKLTPEYIMEAVKSFARYYNDVFLSAYKGSERLKDDGVLLGGGVGFVSKTEVYPLFGKDEGTDVTQAIFRNIKVPQKHGHSKDKSIGVSPHILKCTKYKNKVLQMGVCRITAIEKIY